MPSGFILFGREKAFVCASSFPKNKEMKIREYSSDDFIIELRKRKLKNSCRLDFIHEVTFFLRFLVLVRE